MTGSAHVVLLLGAGGLSPESVLESAALLTRRISIVWYGPGTRARAVRDRWQNRFDGEWIDVRDYRQIPDLLAQLDQRRPVDGIVTFSEPLIVVQAEAQQKLGLPGNSPQVVRTVQSKLAQRRRLAEAGVESIRFHEVRTEDDIPAAVRAVGFPAVLKPVHGAGSFLVSKVGDEHQLRECLRVARARYQDSPLLAPEQAFVLEELLQGANWYDDDRFGDYCSVESLVHDGQIVHIAVTDKLPLYEGFVEAGDIVPTSLPDVQRDQVLAHADRVIEALGIRWGATHLELKLTQDGPACIELNARLGGATGHFIKGSTDSDIVADILLLGLGQAPAGDYQPLRYALFRSLPPPSTAAVLTRQTPREELLTSFPQLVFCKTRYAVGDELRPTQPYSLVTYLVTGADLQECLDTAARVDEAYHAKFEPLPEDPETRTDLRAI